MNTSEYISSGILESYVLDQLSDEERAAVKIMALKHPEIQDEISYEDALRYADSSNEVRLKIKLAKGGDAGSLSQGMEGVEIAETR
mgnify:CR=1 FL=1